MNYDVIIIGGGAAGLSAALWCDDLGLSALLLESNAELGGQLLWTHNAIKNHLGVEARNGREMRDRFLEQIANRKFDIRLKSEISRINFEKGEIFLNADERFSAKFIIIATGVRRRKLNIEGEEKFIGKGIIESGKRDAHLIKNKEVCVVGGGDAAFENALILAETAAKVTLVHRGRDFRARAEFVEKVFNNKKVEILTETVPQKILGAEHVEAVELKDLNTNEIFTVKVQAIVFRIGIEPNTELVRGNLTLDEKGFIEINQYCETDWKGIFAVGDVANPISPTVSSAVGMGATAVKTIYAKLNE
jgi:thioredoxin reductase (NADPH)